ncbi:unnamed protein product [Linum tenue]|uniref:Uncharacterized protein n=1 Tax=Linum tenue TaxID=586396 RepID=A0AAV0S4K2_9ROSI|nr:unnamed protein product [Linum tenue]
MRDLFGGLRRGRTMQNNAGVQAHVPCGLYR